MGTSVASELGDKEACLVFPVGGRSYISGLYNLWDSRRCNDKELLNGQLLRVTLCMDPDHLCLGFRRCLFRNLLKRCWNLRTAVQISLSCRMGTFSFIYNLTNF